MPEIDTTPATALVAAMAGIAYGRYAAMRDLTVIAVGMTPEEATAKAGGGDIEIDDAEEGYLYVLPKPAPITYADYSSFLKACRMEDYEIEDLITPYLSVIANEVDRPAYEAVEAMATSDARVQITSVEEALEHRHHDDHLGASPACEQDAELADGTDPDSDRNHAAEQAIRTHPLLTAMPAATVELLVDHIRRINIADQAILSAYADAYRAECGRIAKGLAA